ncbi:Uncharacterized protein OBRU01_25378 [Operophtera brumata]|uniref:FP protein C-terminal domain-containing protein n=1 Tax=Operophtera brumata TaxID=104452 RepID=A0A0L7K422_OPEBR|nr:Uncharacterized protein OBRU01_25378 [Operophtera brumata]
MDNFDQRLTSSEQRIRAVENLKPSYDDLKLAVVQLQGQMQSQAQSYLRNELEIVGIPESNNENLHHTVLATAQKLGLVLEVGDIDWIDRAGPPRTRIQPGNQPQRSRPVVVRLLRRTKREEIIKAARVRKNLNTTDVGVAGPAVKLFVNERLTKEGRLFFREVRLRAQQCDVKYCWLRNGVTYIRKEEGKAAISIRTSEDLERHLAPQVLSH